jgi:hypothetical protein
MVSDPLDRCPRTIGEGEEANEEAHGLKGEVPVTSDGVGYLDVPTLQTRTMNPHLKLNPSGVR